MQWAAEQVPVARLVVCHLGGGCSVSAVRDGRSIDTTMGFSPLEGVPMATRAGSLDAAAVLYLLRSGAARWTRSTRRSSASRGCSASRASPGSVEELERASEPAARRALDVYCYRVACAVGSLAVALGGLDAIVFTGGVGEGSAFVRAQVCSRLALLGVELDEERNEALAGSCRDRGRRLTRARGRGARARGRRRRARGPRLLAERA